MTTLILSVFFSISASAYDVEVDGIYYLIPKKNLAIVTSGDKKYSGDITIPSSIKVNESEYTVREIEGSAFRDCSGLTSVTILNSVTSIGNYAFMDCSSLTSITIPNSVTSIGYYAFEGCTSLTSVTIPNSVTSIGEKTFSGCSGLTSVTIPNSVTKIGLWAFEACSSLTSITIPNSVTRIVGGAFKGCSSLTSIKIPNSVTSIEASTFIDCSSLTSVTIPNSVISIGSEPFAECSNLENVYCYAERITDLGWSIFRDSYIEYATLHVPSSVLSYYQTTYPWSGFGTIKALEGNEKKCETPTISFVDGKLTFSCETEGAKCHYTISCPDAASGETSTENSSVTLNAYYDITCYAKAEGFINSDVATAKLYWLTSSGTLEGAGINNVSMRGIAIQSAGGFINISGLDNNETVSFYAIDGKSLGSATAINGTTSFAAQSGSIVVAKIGKENIKIAVK